MATKTESQSALIGTVETSDLATGAAGGFVGSILFGLIMQFVIPEPMLEMAIPAMYGIEGPALAAGWAIHQFHGIVLGVVYVLLVGTTGLRETATSMGGAIGLSIGYGILTTLLLAVLVMPLWLSAMGFPGAPPFPNVAVPGTIISTAGHIAFAVPVAIAYALVAGD